MEWNEEKAKTLRTKTAIEDLENHHPDGEKEIPLQLNKLGELLEVLDKEIYSLEERLAPVLCIGIAEEKDDRDKTKERQLVPLAGLLRGRCGHIEAMIYRMRCLYRAIQL